MSDKTAAVKVTEPAPMLNEPEAGYQPTEFEQIVNYLKTQSEMIEELPDSIESRIKTLMTPKEGKTDTYLLLEKVGKMTERNLERQTKQMEMLEKLDQKIDRLLASSESQTPSSELGSSGN